MSLLMRFGLYQTIQSTGTQAFVTRPVRELLFEGYDDLFLSVAAMFSDEGGPPMDKFGWFYMVRHQSSPVVDSYTLVRLF